MRAGGCSSVSEDWQLIVRSPEFNSVFFCVCVFCLFVCLFVCFCLHQAYLLRQTFVLCTRRGENDRDIFNEKPSKEEQMAATQVSVKTTHAYINVSLCTYHPCSPLGVPASAAPPHYTPRWATSNSSSSQSSTPVDLSLSSPIHLFLLRKFQVSYWLREL